ncbi:3',5'-cyclic adenosine monophosphate phosphodiesterase CpdA [Streptomyces longispororuber]|uniref:3',5'-cyclic adenosine monophosphate phosphodiesterase CpdA n=1 Tax=Streptomyces longispororuber TaxID=68230 RepID=A0A918ZZE6_9ACTN|nr:metallophosphoesterase [Streptomyces longispororuber]GHE80306.1 3',5'-cyclic adenosine monophosphate phosphodiesterase CpdA [Streptomyces longispororuber]
MLVLAQVSDLHLDLTARTTERAERVMDHLRALPRPVDALLVTGDIADHGEEAEYKEAARVLFADAPWPVLACPGNHDRRTAFRTALLGAAADASGGAEAPVNSAHRVGGVEILMLDSSVPGSDEGLLDEATYAWLEGRLDALGGETPVLLAFHHHPVALHHPRLDSAWPLREPGRLAALVERHPEIAGLVIGHAHTPAATTFAGRPLVVGPGVVSTLRLPWEGEGLVDLDAPAGFAFHVLDDERRLTTHFRVV